MRWNGNGLPGLALCASAIAIACDTPSVPPDPRDADALLTDAQLVTPRDSQEAFVDPAWEQWIRANRVPIRSITSSRTDDLQFLKQIINDRRLVQLGESGHDVREFSLAKLRLIRFLHEEMGFNVLAFESGFFECWHANRLANDSPEVTLRRCVYPTWHTEEVLALFAYVRERRASGRPLVITGVDVAVSSPVTAREHGPGLLRDVLGRIDTIFASRAARLDSLFHAEFPRVLATAGPHRPTRSAMVAALDSAYGFTSAYDSVAMLIDRNAAQLSAVYASDPQVPLVARQMAWSRVQQISAERSTSFTAYFTARDQAMAGNVEFLLDRLHPRDKVILWAHNAHVMHDRAAARLMNASIPLPQSMGAFLVSRRRAEMYTIGLHMYTGRALNPVTPALPGSLEAILYRARMQWIFVDMLRQSPGAGTSWMFQDIPAKEWGTTDYLLTPRAQFDGLLFLHTISRARFLPSPEW